MSDLITPHEIDLRIARLQKIYRDKYEEPELSIRLRTLLRAKDLLLLHRNIPQYQPERKSWLVRSDSYWVECPGCTKALRWKKKSPSTCLRCNLQFDQYQEKKSYLYYEVFNRYCGCHSINNIPGRYQGCCHKALVDLWTTVGEV